MKKTAEETPLFTEEQLNKMTPRNLAKLILLQNRQLQKLAVQQAAQEQQLRVYEDRVKELEFINAMLNDRLTLANKQRFGSSSEKNTEGYEQLSLFNEAEEAADKTAEEPAYEEADPQIKGRQRKKAGKKKTDLSYFPVVTIEYELPKEELSCPDCGVERKVVTKEIHRSLRFIPAHFETVEEEVYVYSCPVCESMIRAEKAPSLLKGSIATPSLVASIMNGKYVNGLPLYRQSQEFARYGLNLTDRTMANWVIRCAELYLFPVYNRMKEILLSGHYIHCDETRLQVLDEPEQNATTKNWMWVYLADEYSDVPNMVVFQYERTRAGYHPQEFLKGFSGFLTTDGYQGYHRLSESITVTGCMAHGRRRFDQCLTALRKDFTKEQLKTTVAYEALSRIGMLYKIEELIAGKSPEERLKARQEQSKPLVDALFAWLHTLNSEDLNRKTLIGDAILYMLNQEIYLRRYLEDGRLSIDNNSCERAQKTFAQGRRAWLFSKSICGAESSAIIYSITETAKIHGLKPYTYLTYLLETVLDHQNDTNSSFVDELLPWSVNLPQDCKTLQIPENP